MAKSEGYEKGARDQRENGRYDASKAHTVPGYFKGAAAEKQRQDNQELRKLGWRN
jgi:hypothetical protein